MRADSTASGSRMPSAEDLRPGLERILPAERILTRPWDRIAHAADASVYRLVPRAVVRPASLAEVRDLFQFSRAHSVPLVFRAAGTSLSGQAVTDGILADVSRYWRAVEILDNGRRVRVAPGVVGGVVNRLLQSSGTRLGPDPASINTCMIGGILANNSSGMCCGVAQNAYHTLESMLVVLPSGTVIDTASPDADQEFRQREPGIAQGILDVKAAIESAPLLRERIVRKYRMKNTTGYSLNAFVDFERPADILQHLLIGSEGTLAFIASAVLRTVPDLPVKYTGLLFFPGIVEACASIAPLADAGAASLEVMDRSALRSVESQAGMPLELRGLPDEAAGLLMELQSGDERERPDLAARATAALDGLRLLLPPRLTHDADEQAALWKVRQGMFPSVGAARPRATAVIIEDVAFPVERLAAAVVDLTRLFQVHAYPDAIIFGHAKDGNLHFVLSQSFNTQAAIDQYARFMDDLVELVTRRYDGALKAEHGTGRNMAPFVEAEWGAEAWGLMRRVKQLLDPANLLNPGVVMTSDPAAHLANLKTLPVVEDEVDRCIECGYCEPRCPSRDLTLTPRQRIVVRREIERLAAVGGDARLRRSLAADFEYDGLETCAVDGLCATACPVGIDTGQLTKRLRSARHTKVADAVAAQAVRHFAIVEHGIRAGLKLSRGIEFLGGAFFLGAVARGARSTLGRQVPAWLPPMPGPAASHLPATERTAGVAVYFPSCLTRTLGRLPGEPADMTVAQALVAVSQRAAKPVWIPDDVRGCCCGLPWSSKGYVRAYGEMTARIVDRFFEWSSEGRYPIVCDTSPCTHALRNAGAVLDRDRRLRFDCLTVLDSIEFAATYLLPSLEIHRRLPNVTLHPVCSVVKDGLTAQLERIARACSDNVVIPPSAGCCGFAGDRGWLVPELTSSATADEAAEVAAAEETACFSSSRTCEIGMTRATGRPYRSFLYLLEWATRPPAATASTPDGTRASPHA